MTDSCPDKVGRKDTHYQYTYSFDSKSDPTGLKEFAEVFGMKLKKKKVFRDS